MDNVPFIQLLPELLEARAVIAHEMPTLPPTQRETMAKHLEGLEHSIAFIERLGA
jgi:hypothetical protein